MKNILLFIVFGAANMFADEFSPAKQQEVLRENLVGSWEERKSSTSTAKWKTRLDLRAEMQKKLAKAQKVDSKKNKSNEKVLGTERGIASYYYGKWIGRKTANGEIYKADDITAAHKTLPFNTMVRATNLKNGKSIIVRINNRGPFVKGRIIDLSLEAAKRIDMTRCGIVPIKLEILGRKQT